MRLAHAEHKQYSITSRNNETPKQRAFKTVDKIFINDTLACLSACLIQPCFYAFISSRLPRVKFSETEQTYGARVRAAQRFKFPAKERSTAICGNYMKLKHVLKYVIAVYICYRFIM